MSLPELPQDSTLKAPRFGEDRFALLVDSVQDYAIFMLDPKGRVSTWNRGAQRLKQYRADEILGRSFEVFYPAATVQAGWPQHELRVAAQEGRFEDEGWRVRKDGSLFWANVVLTALRGVDGSLQGFAKVTRDLTERRQQEERLRSSEQQLRLLLESVKDYAIFMLDTTGHVLTWNSGAQAIKGYAAAEIVGRHFSVFFTPADRAAGLPASELAAALQDGRAENEGWRVRKDGSLFWANVIISPVRNQDGALLGYVKVTRDLRENRRLSDLERSSRHMEEFIAMLAHELRNPLAPIRNAVAILQAQQETTPAVRRVGELVGRQLGHLTRLVDDLLDVGRIVTGKVALRRSHIDFRDVVHLSVEAMRPLVEQHGHRLFVNMPQAPLPVMADATRLAQALQNLLQNAVRYTPPGGEIRVDVHADAQALTATVADTGMGIEKAALERIFELFVQEVDSRPPNAGGLGIGLSLARTLVQQHGGTLTARSEGPGRGSLFTLTLPLDSSTQAKGGAAGAAAPASAPLRVLVVDDNTDSTDSMVELLKLYGHHARGAYNARQALAVATEMQPQFVLLDINLPDASGYSVFETLRQCVRPPPYVAAMTGYGQRSDRQQTHDAGFDTHLTKPVDPELLLRALTAAAAAGDPRAG